MAPRRTALEWPASDEQFVIEWQPRIRSLFVFKQVVFKEIDDGVQDVMIFLLAGHYREKWDGVRPFEPYMNGMVRVRVDNYIRDMQRRYRNEQQMGIVVDGESREFDVQDRNAHDPSEVADMIDINNALRAVDQELSTYKSSHTQDLRLLFTYLIRQIKEQGEVNHSEIAELYGQQLARRKFTRQAIDQQVDRLIMTSPLQQLKMVLLSIR